LKPYPYFFVAWKNNSAIAERPFLADLYDHLDEKSESEKKDFFADSTFLR